MSRMKPADFRKLQREWYQRLKDEGFEDIEWSGHSLGTSDPGDSPYLKGVFPRDDWDRAVADGREEYFRLASQWLWEHSWAQESDPFMLRRLWEVWCETGSKKQASEAVGLHNSTGCRRIWDLERKMKVWADVDRTAEDDGQG